MTSKFKALTGDTPPLSSGSSTEAEARQSQPSAEGDNTKTFTPTITPRSKGTPPAGKHALTTAEKNAQYAVLMRVLLSKLEKTGLIRRYKVLSKDGKSVKEIQVVFDNTFWTENLDLKVLSDGVVNA